ncbi:MAG: 4Fe-4S ferredoxin, partial [Phycisphaerae bacterium]|nr:4Fe-4S ferredoxin [Phycisphaerae bacterium]
HMPTIVEDIGILASTDPVAVDRAAIDLVEARGGKPLPELIGNRELDWRYQIEHAVKIGLGRAEYELVEVSEQG